MQFQALVDDSFTHKINAPISQTNGIYGALETGRFLVQEIQPATVLPDAKNVINLLTIAGLLRAQVSDSLLWRCCRVKRTFPDIHGHLFSERHHHHPAGRVDFHCYIVTSL